MIKLRNILESLLFESTGKIIAYHGSDSKFNKFNDAQPIFCVDRRDVARTYGDYVYKVELQMSNPIEFDFEGKSTYYWLDKWLHPSKLALAMREIADDMKRGQLEDAIRDELEYEGFSDGYGYMDGIIMHNISDAGSGMFSTLGPQTNYVVFETDQIKIINDK